LGWEILWDHYQNLTKIGKNVKKLQTLKKMGIPKKNKTRTIRQPQKNNTQKKFRAVCVNAPCWHVTALTTKRRGKDGKNPANWQKHLAATRTGRRPSSP
jgi:hypothetical protein